MKKITLWVVAGLLALLLLGTWTWRDRADSTMRPLPTVSTVGALDPPPATELTVTLPPAKNAERAPIPAPAQDAAAIPEEFGLIRVLVLDKATELPFAGAVVTSTHNLRRNVFSMPLVPGPRGKPFEAIAAGADGRVEIEMPLGVEAQVSASSRAGDAGSAQAVVPALLAGESREVVLRLTTGEDMPFWMQLVEEESRAPLPETPVVVSMKAKAPLELETDAQGFFFCAARTWSSATIRVEPKGRTYFYLGAEPGHATVETALVVTVPAAATLRIAVSDAAGAPIRNADVLLTTSRNYLCRGKGMDWSHLLPDPSWSAKTDGAGIATLTELPVRVLLCGSLTSPKPWNAMELITLESGETRTVPWKLGGGSTLRGLVLDQHEKPVADRTIWLRRAERRTPLTFVPSFQPTRTTKTDAGGRFRFDEVDVGGWSVGPGALNYGQKRPPDDVVPLAQYVETVAGQLDAEVTIHVDRGLFICGRVVSADGEPLFYVSVRAYYPGRGLGAVTSSQNSDGKFELGPLAAGRYAVVADSNHDTSERVEVQAGTEGLELRLKPAAVLTGRVVGVDGVTSPAEITLTRRGSKWASAFAYQRKDIFEADRLDAGTYDLAAITTDGSVGVLEGIVMKSGETRKDLTITVSPGGRVRVRHEGPDLRVNVTILQRDIVFVTSSVLPTSMKEFVVPVGSVVVRANYVDDDRRQVERVVEVKAGETVEVTFEKGGR